MLDDINELRTFVSICTPPWVPPMNYHDALFSRCIRPASRPLRGGMRE
jgi:hypothetical protein